MTTRIFKNNDELKALIKKRIDGNKYIDFEGYNIICEFDIDLGGVSLINARNIDARNIEAGNIKAGNIKARNISAWNIDARNIEAGDIKARNIKAGNIKAGDIDYYALCFAYESITCKSIEGKRANSKHFCLDGEIIINK